ncbi:hypothetical protein [Mogibacterium sp.]|uniref:hypothetical protein n=1 Tax=Mogibacterium sp. TaxID=2049035 RepID=UPI00257A17FD|nr:hypothetical protein [Mogibacterium sp.]MBN2935877.1 hypothetical protein [Mogibacterium sp.]
MEIKRDVYLDKLIRKRKIVVVGDNIKVRRDENGIITIGLRNFLLDENSLKL